jgi:uncharacterized protein YgiM (DUF1202 family)
MKSKINCLALFIFAALVFHPSVGICENANEAKYLLVVGESVDVFQILTVSSTLVGKAQSGEKFEILSKKNVSGQTWVLIQPTTGRRGWVPVGDSAKLVTANSNIEVPATPIPTIIPVEPANDGVAESSPETTVAIPKEPETVDAIKVLEAGFLLAGPSDSSIGVAKVSKDQYLVPLRSIQKEAAWYEVRTGDDSSGWINENIVAPEKVDSALITVPQPLDQTGVQKPAVVANGWFEFQAGTPMFSIVGQNKIEYRTSANWHMGSSSNSGTANQRFQVFSPTVGFLVGYQTKSRLIGLKAAYLRGVQYGRNIEIEMDDGETISTGNTSYNFMAYRIGPVIRYMAGQSTVKPFIELSVGYAKTILTVKDLVYDSAEMEMDNIYFGLSFGILKEISKGVLFGGSLSAEYYHPLSEAKHHDALSGGSRHLEMETYWAPVAFYLHLASSFEIPEATERIPANEY